MAANVDTATAGMERCVSCNAPLSGRYCSRCGERRLEPDALTLRHFVVHTVVHELLHVDGALWRTLRLLFVPAGVPRSLSVEDTIQLVDPYGLLRRQAAAKREQLASQAARERFHARLAAFAQPVSFTNVVLLAATLHLVFRWKRRRFLEHVAFSMHAVSFVLLSSVTLFVAIGLRFWLGRYLFLTFGLIGLWQFAYLAVAIRRFYLAKGHGEAGCCRWPRRCSSTS